MGVRVCGGVSVGVQAKKKKKKTLKMTYILLHQLGRRKAEEHPAPSGLLRKQGSDWNAACGTEQHYRSLCTR